MTLSNENLNYILLAASVVVVLLDRAGYKLPILSGLIGQLAAMLGKPNLLAPKDEPKPGPIPTPPPAPTVEDVKRMIEEALKQKGGA